MNHPLTGKLTQGRTDLVFQIVGDGQSASSADQDGTTLMAWCAYHGDVSAIRFLQSRGASLELLGDNLGLDAAAFHGHWQLCQFLLENGADVHYASPTTGETAMHNALCKANRPVYEHVVRVLIAHGADPNHRTIAGVETAAFMRDVRTRGETPLHRAAAFGTEAIVQALLDAGARRDVKDAGGETPLTWASWHLRPPAILRMLCYGEFAIHPANDASYDHGDGWGQIDAPHMGRPVLS